MINTAIIGVSGFGRVHYSDLLRYHERGEVRILGATVINQSEELEKCEVLRGMGCELFEDHREMLDRLTGEIDLCMIPTGIGLHAPMAIDAMRSGANCLIEKPAAATVQDVAAMRRVEGETGKFVAVGYSTIFQPENHAVKRDILAGKLGRVRLLKGIGLWPRKSSYYGRNGWAGKLKNGEDWILDSPFNNALAHYLNLLLFFAGSTFETSAKPITVEAALLRGNPELENADAALIRLETDAGVDVLFNSSHCCRRNYGPVLEIIGEKGSIIWSQDSITRKLGDSPEETISIDNHATRDHQMDAVLDRIAHPSRFACDLAVAGAHTLAVNGAHESSPIISVPSDRVDLVDPDDDLRYVCDELDEVLESSFAAGCLPDSSTPSWIQFGEPFSTRGYATFAGGKAFDKT